MIPNNYPEEERAVLFGLNTGFGSIASAGLLFVIALAELPWRSAFLLYGFFLNKINLRCTLFVIAAQIAKPTSNVIAGIVTTMATAIDDT